MKIHQKHFFFYMKHIFNRSLKMNSIKQNFYYDYLQWFMYYPGYQFFFYRGKYVVSINPQ